MFGKSTSLWFQFFAAMAVITSASGLGEEDSACAAGAEDCNTKGIAKNGHAMLQKRGMMKENIASVTAEVESMPTSCTANNKYNSKQVSVCGCGSKRFPAGSTFLLNGKSLTVGSSWKSACSKSCGKDYCATVNLDKEVGSSFSWKSEDEITFPEAEDAPVADCTANNKYNSKQVSVCGCGPKKFPAGSTFLLNGKSLTVASSFRSACSAACGKDYCATVNLDKQVGSGFSWKSGDAIALEKPEEAPIEAPIEASTAAPTLAAPICKNKFCNRATRPWAEKCQWVDCKGCSGCEGPVCLQWCTMGSESWADKCSYEGCKYCDECVSFRDV